MSEILDKLLAVSKEIGPPPKRYGIVVSTVKRSWQKMSDYDRFAQLPAEAIGLGSVMPVIPHPFSITKTVQRTKRFRRMNRPPKVKVKDVQVPAIMLMDMSIFDFPKAITPIFPQTIERPKASDYDRLGIY